MKTLISYAENESNSQCGAKNDTLKMCYVICGMIGQTHNHRESIRFLTQPAPEKLQIALMLNEKKRTAAKTQCHNSHSPA